MTEAGRVGLAALVSSETEALSACLPAPLGPPGGGSWCRELMREHAETSGRRRGPLCDQEGAASP